MIDQIKLTNFKSFSKLELGLRPMTLLSGLNNSGKSSVIQAIRMVQNWVETGDPTILGHGSLEEMKNRKSARKSPMEISIRKSTESIDLKIDFSSEDKPEAPVFRGADDILPLICYLGAERWGPRVYLPVYNYMGELTHVGEYGEYVVDFLARHELDIVDPSLKHPKSEGDTLEYNVRSWLTEIAPGITFKHETERKIDTSYAMINGFRPPNTGFGLSYTLPVIVLLLGMAAEWRNETQKKVKKKKGVLILMENPEAHLHPRGQTVMGKLIAYTAATGVQIVVETHSEHIMDGIRLAVKEGGLSNKDAIFHFFENKEITEDKLVEFETVVTTPSLHADGKLDFWPEGFFDQTLINRAKLAGRR